MTDASFHWDDPLQLEQQLTSEERMVRDAARDYAQSALAPRVLEAFRHERTDVAIFREMGALGMLGSTLVAEYGGAGLNQVSYGLVAREIERIDSGFRSMMSVQSSLVILPIFAFGTEAQRRTRAEGPVPAQVDAVELIFELLLGVGRPWRVGDELREAVVRIGRYVGSLAK